MIPWPLPRAISSAGRAPPRQGGGHWFEPSIAHRRKALPIPGFWLFAFLGPSVVPVWFHFRPEGGRQGGVAGRPVACAWLGARPATRRLDDPRHALLRARKGASRPACRKVHQDTRDSTLIDRGPRRLRRTISTVLLRRCPPSIPQRTTSPKSRPPSELGSRPPTRTALIGRCRRPAASAPMWPPGGARRRPRRAGGSRRAFPSLRYPMRRRGRSPGTALAASRPPRG